MSTTRRLMKFTTSVKSQKKYIIAFFDDFLGYWRFGCGYNGEGSVGILDLRPYATSLENISPIYSGSSWRASIHDNFESLAPEIIIKNSSQLAIYEVSHNYALLPVSHLKSKIEIFNWVQQNVS